jgi:type VI secretion system protein VasD
MMRATARRRRGRWRDWLPLSTVILLAIAQIGAADTVRVKGEISTAADLNPDYQGRPSPVNLILFQLKSADNFQNADFFSLYSPDGSILGGDLIERTQVQLRPGEKMPAEWHFDEGARFIGVIAAFREIEKAQWRGLIELPERGLLARFFRRNRMFIDVDALAVSVTTKPSEAD